MANRSRRVMKEIQDCQKDINLSNINIEPIGSDMSKLRGKFPGPPNSPYEGGIFEVSIDIPDRYPFEPLKMKFITKVYHPNISSQSGAICLDILKDAWSPVLTLKTTLVSLQSLLCSPEPNDPQDAEVAKVYLTDRSTFERTARYWTETYAKPTKSSNSSSSFNFNNLDEITLAGLNPAYVHQFESMGFQRHQIIEVMKKLNYRGKNVSLLGEDAVIEALLST
ncbi:ubiquitin-conjugating enzyme/RWD-like protein [Melampsora americana]|nr:ubiquitin-conjugating enzyme/RWD-like protein [Melampsora americana]